MPRDLVSGIARSPLGSAPGPFAIVVLTSPGAVFDLRLRGTFDSETDARQFAATARELIAQVLELLKELPPLASSASAAFRKTLQGIEVETDRVDFGRPRVRWNKDGRHFTYEQVDRGHQRFRLIEVLERIATPPAGAAPGPDPTRLGAVALLQKLVEAAPESRL